MKYKALEFFSGIGGLHTALKEVSPDSSVIASFDINPNAYLVYHHNYPDVPYYERDIVGITVEDVDLYNADIWLLSPPCQPHTRLGLKNDCLDKRSDGLMHLIDLLQKMKNNPKFLLLENVEGFEESRSRELLVQTLKERGYSYLEFILSPNQFKIPNQRDRYYLIARQTSFPEIPESTPRINNCLRVIPGDVSCTNIIYQNGTAEMGTKESQELWDSLNSNCKTIQEFLDDEQTLGKNYSSFFLTKETLEKSGNILDIVTPEDKFSCCFTKAYRKFHRGTGSVLQTQTPYQQPPIARDLDNLLSLKLRYFTGSEMKRLLGFPESFTFPESMNEKQRTKLAGNSLSVTVVAALLKYLLDL